MQVENTCSYSENQHLGAKMSLVLDEFLDQKSSILLAMSYILNFIDYFKILTGFSTLII